MVNDMYNHDKTVGEATTHNAVATGIGVGTTVGPIQPLLLQVLRL